MNEFEQSYLEEETNDSHDTCYQNAIRYKEKENAFIKNCKYVLFFLVFVIRLGGSMTGTFKVTPTTFYEISKISLHICSIFRKKFCFLFVSEKRV